MAGEWKSYLIKVAANGTPLWEQMYGYAAGNGHNAAEFLALIHDGGYLLCNDSDSIGNMTPNNFGFMKRSPAP